MEKMNIIVSIEQRLSISFGTTFYKSDDDLSRYNFDKERDLSEIFIDLK